MSLVNDVLRQIDQKSHSQERVKAALPLSLQHISNNRDKTQLFILSLTALIVVVYLLQLSFTGFINKDEAQVNRLESLQIINNKEPSLEVTDSEIIEPVILASLVDTPKVKMIAAVEELPVEKPQSEPIHISPMPVKKIAISTRKLKETIVFKKASNPEEVLYQEALGYFISGDIDKSERILKNTLDENTKGKYLELQARIHMERKDANSFYQLVKKYPENNSTSWYKLIAPGLQLFSYYHLSNQYYDALIKIEPNQIQWQLAVALNYTRLGENRKSVTIYERLASSDGVSDRQKKWLIKKIKRLTLSKA